MRMRHLHSRGFIACALFAVLGVCGHARAAQVYWADYANDRIQRANVDGGGVQTVLGNLPGITALAVDDVHGTIYWSETVGGNRIRRSSLDGSNVTTLLETPGMVYDIALDVPSNLMFFGQGGTETTIQMIRGATISGGSPFTVVGPKNGNEANYTPYAVGLYDGQVYYAGSGGSAIRRVNYDGTGDQVFVDVAGGNTFALHVKPNDAYLRLYWLDEDDDYLRTTEDPSIVLSLRSVGGDYGERYPWGFAGDGQRLYWSDALTHLIQSVDYDGNDYQSFPVDGEPRRIALVVPEPGCAMVTTAITGCFILLRRVRISRRA